MAESCTVTEETFGTIKKVKWAWVSAADGTVGAALIPTVTSNAYSGEIVRLVTIPARLGWRLMTTTALWSTTLTGPMC